MCVCEHLYRYKYVFLYNMYIYVNSFKCYIFTMMVSVVVSMLFNLKFSVDYLYLKETLMKDYSYM